MNPSACTSRLRKKWQVPRLCSGGECKHLSKNVFLSIPLLSLSLRIRSLKLFRVLEQSHNPTESVSKRILLTALFQAPSVCY